MNLKPMPQIVVFPNDEACEQLRRASHPSFEQRRLQRRHSMSMLAFAMSAAVVSSRAPSFVALRQAVAAMGRQSGNSCEQGLWLDPHCAVGLRPLGQDASFFPSTADLAVDPRAPLLPAPPWASLPTWVQISAPFIVIVALAAVTPIFFGLGPFGVPLGEDFSTWLQNNSAGTFEELDSEERESRRKLDELGR
eukprot:TRINITY_DN66099_c0_g1_i1.p1 TRINITY_DN66099_c0_g1~~TRINITY_DN66099_c0_g1_i1.p1  ORF type:complete len:193 (+),score=18.65 TRINITY_DN66099_c0_g1_i1:48-626(+)